MQFEYALARAEKAMAYLRPFTRRIEIAGSIRRRKRDEIKDIELVAIPHIQLKVVDVNHYDIFMGERQEKVNELNVRVKQLVNEGTFARGDLDKSGKNAPLGPKYYRLKYDGINLDLFVVIQPAQWGLVFLLRTGSAEFSQWFVTRLWKFNRRAVDGHIINGISGETTYTPEESDAFKACGLEFVPPEDRSAQWISKFEASGAK